MFANIQVNIKVRVETRNEKEKKKRRDILEKGMKKAEEELENWNPHEECLYLLIETNIFLVLSPWDFLDRPFQSSRFPKDIREQNSLGIYGQTLFKCSRFLVL